MLPQTSRSLVATGRTLDLGRQIRRQPTPPRTQHADPGTAAHGTLGKPLLLSGGVMRELEKKARTPTPPLQRCINLNDA
ncbi:hypothetical protein VTK26DRAFT_8136 [Humicola hyalothermophila]